MESTPTSSLASRLSSLLNYCKNNGLGPTLRFIPIRLRASLATNEFGWNLFFKNNPFILTGELDDYANSVEDVWAEFKKVDGLTCEHFVFQKSDYDEYVKLANYERFSPYYEGNNSGREDHRSEKLLQHFLSLQLLQIAKDDTYVDVASNTSPMRHIVKDLYGCKVYSLDLSYPPGINGELIGADGGAMPFADNSINKMTLHCSFEHFAYGSDIRFIRECARVLAPGGKVCIVPFYVLPRYSVRVDPTLEGDISVKDTEGADLVYVRDYRVDYGRHYSPAQVYERLVKNANGLKLRVIKIDGLEQFGAENVYSHFALMIEK